MPKQYKLWINKAERRAVSLPAIEKPTEPGDWEWAHLGTQTECAVGVNAWKAGFTAGREYRPPCPECKGLGEVDTGIGLMPCSACHDEPTQEDHARLAAETKRLTDDDPYKEVPGPQASVEEDQATPKPVTNGLCPKAHHWGGSIGVYNIVKTDKATGERVVLESNLHGDQVDVPRRATKLWGEHNKLEDPITSYVDAELVGYFANDPVKAKGAPKYGEPCPVCGK